VYVTWLYLIFMYILPFTLLAVLNLLIYMEIRKATAIRNSLSRSQKREIGLAMMLLCVVLVFFLCNILALIVNILEHFGGDIDITWLTQTNNLLVTLNSSVNFVIYCIFGDKFKRAGNEQPRRLAPIPVSRDGRPGSVAGWQKLSSS